jgi:hypothetical protein
VPSRLKQNNKKRAWRAQNRSDDHVIMMHA